MSQALADLTASVWAFAAAGALAEGGVPPELDEPVRAVVAAAGLVPDELDPAELRNTLLQAADLVARSRERTLTAGWSHTDAMILQAQGAVSAQPVRTLVQQVLPGLGVEVRDFLDVGAGVGAMCIELCRLIPEARAVGLEPLEEPLALARRNVAEAGLEDRIELRRQTVEELRDEEAFDVAWLASMFMPRAALTGGLPVLRRALRPGGIVVTAVMGAGTDGLPAAAARLRGALWGAEVTLEEMEEMGRAAGFADVVRGPARGAGTPLILRR